MNSTAAIAIQQGDGEEAPTSDFRPPLPLATLESAVRNVDRLSRAADTSEARGQRISRTSGSAQDIVAAAAALVIPRIPTTVALAEKRQIVLQEWEGHVLEIYEHTFTARLSDLTSRDMQEQEEADFPIDDLAEDEKKLLQRGAVFRWLIGYQVTKGGTKTRISQIVMRRLPQWTQSELESGKLEGKRLAAAISWE